MIIPDIHNMKLKFKIYNATPKEYMDKWIELKNMCENGNNEGIINELLYYCKLESVKKLPYLNRCEGGIGGNNNNINKQLRFRKYHRIMELPGYKDNDIVFDNIINTTTEKWTLNELNDIMRGFSLYANNYCNINDSIDGYIEIEYDKYLDDNDLDDNDYK
jgi:hypothetical protein